MRFCLPHTCASARGPACHTRNLFLAVLSASLICLLNFALLAPWFTPQGQRLPRLQASPSLASLSAPPGLLGDGFPYLLDLARRRVVQPGATVIPSAATLYCMGLEVLTGEVAGFNMAAVNTYR